MAIDPVTAPAIEREELLQRARALAPVFKERAFATEEAGRVSDQTREEIVAAQLHKIAVPVRFGGFDVEFDLHHEVAIELGRACGATAWCFSLWGAHNYWLAFFHQEAQQELYADGPDLLTSSASFCAKGSYQRVPGGYRVSGRWRFVSGCDHAAWVFAEVPGPDGSLAAIIPRSEFEIIEGTWNVAGLQGTGSKDIVAEDAFVPDHRTQLGGGPDRLFDPDTPANAGPYDYHPQRRYGVPKPAVVIWDLVAPAIGMAQGALDEMVARLQGTSGRATSADSPVVQQKVAESAAEIDAARAVMLADIADAQDRGEGGEPITVTDLARYARDRAYAVKLSVSAADRLFDMAGGRALFLTDPMQRIHRDVHAAMHRDGLVFDFAGQPYGRALLGMDPVDLSLFGKTTLRPRQ